MTGEGFTCKLPVTFAIETIKLLGGHCFMADVEPAIIKFLSNTEGIDIVAERKKLPISKRRKNVSLTLHENILDGISNLAAGQKIKGTIIEVAIWKYFKEASTC